MAKKNERGVLKLKKIKKKINKIQQNNILINELNNLKKEKNKNEIKKEKKKKKKKKIEKEKEKLEPEKLEQEKLELEKLESEKLEPEKLEPEKLEPKKLEPEKLEPKKLELEKLELEKLEPEKLGQEKFEEKLNKNLKHKDFIKNTRSVSKKQKEIEKEILELKNSNKKNIQKINKQNSISEYFEFIVQQYAGPLSINFMNVFLNLFSSTHIKKVYFLLLSAYNFFFNKDKAIASLILFSFEHAHELAKNK